MIKRSRNAVRGEAFHRRVVNRKIEIFSKFRITVDLKEIILLPNLSCFAIEQIDFF